MGICAFFYMQNLCGVVVLHRSVHNWSRRDGISLPWVYMSNLFGVVVLHRSMVN